MSWALVDDNAPLHIKQVRAGAVACWLWTCGLAYANKQSARDGFIHKDVARCLYPIKGIDKAIQKLIDVKLWEAFEDGYLIHDFHDVNDSKEEAVAKKTAQSLAKSEAGRIGGLASAEKRRQAAEQAAAAANDQATVQAESKQPFKQTASTKSKQIQALSSPISDHENEVGASEASNQASRATKQASTQVVPR